MQNEINEALSLLQDLVRIPSVNPDLVPGAHGERAIAEHICNLMREWGLEIANREVAPGRHNAIGILHGSGGGRTLLFNGHTDTVTTEDMSEPFSGDFRNGRVYGRGSFDMKASLAATLAATHWLVANGPALRGDLVLTFVADEEFASIGTQAVVEDIRQGHLPRPDAAINTEPSFLKLGIAHKGFVWIEIETVGKAAHGSRPDLGVDAIAHMGRVLGKLEALQQRLADGRRHRLLGTGSIHASLVRGGRELSSYPDRCVLQVERRTVPPESEHDIAREIDEVLRELSVADATFRARSRVTLARSAWEADLQSPIVKALAASIQQVTGKPAEMMTQTGWLDSALLGGAGIPTIVFGPGGDGAHAVVEWADVESVNVCAHVYSEVVRRFCM